MAEDGALQLDKVNSAEIKRSRSGRACLPRLAFWAGERLFTSLNSNESPLYIPPKQIEKSNASYITPTTGLQDSVLSSASSVNVAKSSKRTTHKQYSAPLKRLNSPNKHASNKTKRRQSKEKKTKSQSNPTVKPKISRLKSKSGRRALTSPSEGDSQSDDLNHLQQSKKGKSARKPILSDEFTSSAKEDKSPKQNNLYSSSDFRSSSSKDLNHTNNLNNLQSTKKKNVTWSDTETNSPFPKRNIFMTAISNSRRLRSATSTVQKSALANKQSNIVINCPSVEDEKLKLANTCDPHDDQDILKPARDKKAIRAKAQKRIRTSPVKRKSTRTASKSKENKVESKPVSNGNTSKRKRKKDTENKKPSSVKSQISEPTKNKNSAMRKISSSSSDSDEHLNTPRRQRCPKRKRLTRVITEDTDSDSVSNLISKNKSDRLQKIAVSLSPEEDSLLLDLFSNDVSKKPVSKVNAKTAMIVEDNIPETDSTSYRIEDLSSIPETVSDSELENIEEHDADESSEDDQDYEISPHGFESQSKKTPAVTEKNAGSGGNKDIHENKHLAANTTQCCILDLFCDSPKPKERRKTASAISRLSKFADARKNVSKKHNKSLNNLKRDINTQLLHAKRPAIDPNMKIGDWHKRTCLRKEIIDKKVPKAGTLKGKKWLQKQLDDMNQGHNDNYFADADSPNMKSLPKQLDTTKDNSDLSLNFTTPRPKFPSDLYTRKLPSPEINESLLEFITNKNLADAYNHKREKRLKAKGSDEAQEENGADDKPDEEKASQSSTPPILTQESIKRAVQNVNDMLSRISATKAPEVEASYISSDELEDYYFNDP